MTHETVDTETGEIQTAEPTQLRIESRGFGRFESVMPHTVLTEAQPLGTLGEGRNVTVTVVRVGSSLAVELNVPTRLGISEADLLKGMLDRAVKSAKKIAEKIG